jgi:hypothetical protein
VQPTRKPERSAIRARRRKVSRIKTGGHRELNPYVNYLNQSPDPRSFAAPLPRF